MKAIVVGGGIGGTTAALSLLKHGIEVEVYERAQAFGEIGAGLQIAANAVRVLNGLDLGEELAAVGVAAGRLDMRDLHSDRPLYAVPLGREAHERYGEPFYQVHRRDLLDMLVRAVPDGVLRLGAKAVGFSQDDEGVTVRFESGHETRGDLLIGADGIHSVVRRELMGEQELEFSRIVAWRSLIPVERIAHLDLPADCHCWWGPGRSAVAYYVHARKLLNFVGIVPSEEARDESWTERGEIDAVRHSFEGSTTRLRQIVELIDEPFITGYYFRYPLSHWSEGRVTILGDAAHPMHPFLAQGACQAIEDGAVLANVLAAAGQDRIPAALKEYEQRRLGRASRVQTVARIHQRMWHMAEPREVAERNRMLRSTMELDPYAETVWAWLFRYDADKASQEPLVEPGAHMGRPESRQAWRMWANMLGPEDLDNGHHGIRAAYDRFLLTNFPAPEKASIDPLMVNEVPCVRVRCEADDDGPVLVHFHGGGYVLGSAEASVGLAARLSAAAGGPCLAVGYRRAPEHPYPAAIEDGVNVYLGLLADGVDARRVVFTGESAGGGLAVAVAVRLRDMGRALPAGIAAISPMADLAITGDSVDAYAAREPIATRTLLTQMAASYLQGHDPRDPLASPIYAKLHGLPPLLVQVAEEEALYSDAARLVDAARRDGVDADLDVYKDTVHVFPIFDFLPESTEAVGRLGQFVEKLVG